MKASFMHLSHNKLAHSKKNIIHFESGSLNLFINSFSQYFWLLEYPTLVYLNQSCLTEEDVPLSLLFIYKELPTIFLSDTSFLGKLSLNSFMFISFRVINRRLAFCSITLLVEYFYKTVASVLTHSSKPVLVPSARCRSIFFLTVCLCWRTAHWLLEM